MRRLIVVIGVLMLALPAAADALMRGPNDGTLVVDNAQGVVVLNVRGGIIGRIDSGTIEVTDPVPGDGHTPVVRGYERARELGPKRTQYSGQTEIRFRLIGGFYRVRISAIGIDVGAVGRGTVILDGSGFADQPGRYSIDGAPYEAMPGESMRLTLGQPLPVTPASK
jgi:hypothetical protein